MQESSQEIVGVIEAFADCWNRHDMPAFAQLFAEDAEFVNVVGMYWKGREEIRRAHEFTHGSIFKDSRLSLVEHRVRLPAAGLATVRTRWALEGHAAPDGTPLPPRHGLMLSLLRREDDGWRILEAQNTDILEGEVSRPQ